MGLVATSEIELVEASQTGDVEAFTRLVERYKALVYAVSFSATGDRVLSEDVAQETFLSAWQCLTELREPAKLRSWLCGIARNLGHKALRRRGREVPSGLDLDAVEVRSRRATVTPLEATIDHESEQIVWDALRRMPETYREPLVLFHQQDKSVEQVANDLGLSTGAVKKRLHRGRRYLKENVAEIVERTLSQNKPSKGFVAVVVGAISAGASVPAQASASTTAVVKTSTITSKGGWIMFAKIGLGVAVVGAAIAIWLFTSEGGREGRVAQAASGESLKTVVGEGAAAATSPITHTVGADEHNAGTATPSGQTALGQNSARPSGAMLVTKYGGIEHDAMEVAKANGLGQCFGFPGKSRRVEFITRANGELSGVKLTTVEGEPVPNAHNTEVCLVDHLNTAGYASMSEHARNRALSSAFGVCPGGSQSHSVQPFDVNLDLSIRNGAVTAASFIGEHPFGDKADQIESCVHKAFSNAEFSAESSESSKRLWYAVEQKQEPPAPDPELYNALAIAEGPSRGSKDAPVTAVAFVDFRCRYSSRLLGTLDQLLDEYDGKIRLVVKQFPVNSGSDIAAEAALAAASQGKFWEMHDALFANQTSSGQPDYSRYAGEIGLDVAQFESDMAGHRFADAVKAEQDEGYSMGIMGTPALLINGQRLSGARPIDWYRTVIDDALKSSANE